MRTTLKCKFLGFLNGNAVVACQEGEKNNPVCLEMLPIYDDAAKKIKKLQYRDVLLEIKVGYEEVRITDVVQAETGGQANEL